MAGKKSKPKKTTKKPDSEKLKPLAVLCPVCRTIVIEPVTLPCDHAFCRECFEETMEKANLVCPLCRLRVGSWFRRAKKQGSLVNRDFWKAVQQQYPVEVANKLEGIDNDMEEDKPVIIVASPGEIRKEYEKERQKYLEKQRRLREAEELASAALIKKITEEEEYERQARVADELSTPSTSKTTPRRSLKPGNSKKYGPMDRFLRSNDASTSSGRSSLSKKSPRSPKKYMGKEYTCHVLPVQHTAMKMAQTSSLFDDLDLKGILGTLGQKPTKTSELDRRKSVSPSSGDDSIDQECNFYFKPIDPPRGFRFHRTMALKPPTAVLGVNDGTVPIRPPSGDKADLLTSERLAFARFSKNPSRNEIEGEISPYSFRETSKRKTSSDLVDSDTQSVTSPCYGFDNTSYEFDTRRKIEAPKRLKRDLSPLRTPDINKNIPKANSNRFSNLSEASSSLEPNKVNTLINHEEVALRTSPDLFERDSEDEDLSDSPQVKSNRKRLQEEADFELAKKLQAEFDLTQVAPWTRRRTRRQITLDDMLAV